MKGSECRMEVRALSSSQRDTLVPKSHHAECCGQIRFPKELGLLAVLWHWDSLHALATGPAVEVSGIPSALEAFITGHVFPCHSQSQVPAMLSGLDLLWRWVLHHHPPPPGWEVCVPPMLLSQPAPNTSFCGGREPSRAVV